MKKITIILFVFLFCSFSFAQITQQKTYMNPVIPGDHPDPTLTKVGKDFYTSGSSFNPTPKIYHSTDLVHWEVIAQPVSPSWTEYGNSPGGGIWGGHMVYYKGKYWHFFGRGGGSMYFVTADKPEGPWSTPTRMRVPSSMPAGLGVDNSIFIDEDTGKWYLLTKAGQPNNHIVELGDDGQPTGKVYNLTWLNPAPSYPYGWAEGPVMWKHNGYYYYSFAQHLVGSQYVMRSDTLTDDKSKWTIIGTNIFTGSSTLFTTPNHISPAVKLDDGTSWVIAHSYHSSNWYAQGRQGLLCQVVYDENDFPKILRPSSSAAVAPNLPSNGIPWAVPHSDNFNSVKLHPEWSFLGYTPDNTYSLTERPGWLKLVNINKGGRNTVIKNDGEHSYSLITRVDFEPESTSDEAGLWIINGPETHQVKLCSTLDQNGNKVISFSFKNTIYQVENTIGSTLWLKLVRNEHKMSGYYSSDGFYWFQVGNEIDASEIDKEVTQFNNFTGNYQGLYTIGSPAFFDLYIYRDAYTEISALNPADQYGTTPSTVSNTLNSIHNNDWAMYAGVEFGNNDYPKKPDSLIIVASSNTSGGKIEVVIDSLNGTKIAECEIVNTGSWSSYKEFKTNVLEEFSGMHDLFLIFKGNENQELFRLKSLRFITNSTPTSMNDKSNRSKPATFELYQNYPNPFNPSTTIKYTIPVNSEVTIKIFDLMGKEIAVLANNKYHQAGTHTIEWNGKDKNNNEVASGIYFCQVTNNLGSRAIKLILSK
ncbi:family 43 glycosylhydrolase [Melioribacter sp. OK-6-Me]|uniref:family 43 glycosylhydrolase n=1 Tax=unclassified Melioribacter TaxID=2627329 RepID=UPI003ED93514